jgi:hypothetical protein
MRQRRPAAAALAAFEPSKWRGVAQQRLPNPK